MPPPGPPALLLSLSLALGATACVESGTYEKATAELDAARRAGAQKDEQIRAYQWQLAALGQQLRDGQQQSLALQRELYAQAQQLTAANAVLTEQLKKAESERSALLLAASAEPPPAATGRDAKASLRPEELRRMIAAADARNAQILEELGRLERLLGSSPRPPADGAARPRGPAAAGDIVDPWGFGSRK